MKYVITKSGKVRTTTNSGHHRDLAQKRDVVSAGRYMVDRSGRVRTYSKSYGFGIHPKAGDAAAIRKHIGKSRA